MNRLLVALLSAFDALVAAAVGVAAALAPLAVLWVLGLGSTADWGALWPTAVSVWQLGHLVPLEITLPDAYLVATGIPVDASPFVLSLAPLAFSAFTAIAGARSGVRAARAGAWPTGVATGALALAALAAVLAVTASNPVAAVVTWQAVLLPVLIFAVPALVAAVVVAWRVGDDGPIDTLHGRMRELTALTTGAVARAVGAVAAGLVGLGSLVVALGLIGRAGQVFALYQGAGAGVVGAVMLLLAQAAYLPTLVVWALAFAAGPGIALGVGTSVSPAGTTVGVVPGIPILGILPDSVSPWMLAIVLTVVAVGFLGGYVARGPLLATSMTVRAVAAGAIALAAAGLAALGAVLASGSMGPDSLAHTGPAPGPLALAVGIEIAVGAAIALLTPARGVVGAYAGRDEELVRASGADRHDT